MTHSGLAVAVGNFLRNPPVFARLATVCLLCPVLALLATSAQAELVFFEKNFAEMGQVPNAGSGICAAAANINSLVYLRNHFPGVYADTNLIPDWNEDNTVDFSDELTSRDKMAFGWEHGGIERSGIYGSGNTGTAQQIWEATYWWFEDFAPGTSVLDGQTWSSGMATWEGGEVLEGTYPKWKFLWDSLVAQLDIELGIVPTTVGISHAVTLTGLAFDDLDGDGWWDADEEPKQIGFLDPNKVSEQTWADVTYSYGRLEFEWWQTGGTYYIYRAFTEGPALIPGDANGDGVVDESDAASLAANWGLGNTTWEMGDFNGDHSVGPADASILAANWGYGSDESTLSTVPEPSALLLLIGMLAGCSARKTRR